jgi:hypothetical protein
MGMADLSPLGFSRDWTDLISNRDPIELELDGSNASPYKLVDHQAVAARCRHVGLGQRLSGKTLRSQVLRTFRRRPKQYGASRCY